MRKNSLPVSVPQSVSECLPSSFQEHKSVQTIAWAHKETKSKIISSKKEYNPSKKDWRKAIPNQVLGNQMNQIVCMQMTKLKINYKHLFFATADT